MEAVPITFGTCVAIEDDYYLISAKPDVLDADQELARLFFFDATLPDGWRYVDISDFTIADVCVVDNAIGKQRRYAVLSREGEIIYYSPGEQFGEKVIGAGLKSDGPVYGYLNKLKEVDGTLYACGGGGQIYRRSDDGWEDIAGPLRREALPPLPNIVLNPVTIGDDVADIDGYSPTDMYAAVGRGIYHYDGDQWKRCGLPFNEIIMAITCAPDGFVWACGFNGLILCGNTSNGFSAVQHDRAETHLTKVTLFKGKLYFASNQGLLRQRLKEGTTVLEKVPSVPVCDDLSTAGEVLLCVGSKSIHLLQSGVAAELSHPDN
ncbi:hypothetical protein RMR16_024775 (plasmid) [Agrobacterium sp. rho-13.3]|uniref:hypothetical protein n=1 Tax=Agrobacterium sp. rho-13.3 TaxID=3072980 RepID=UPI002A0B8C00|nr:hypothetical protein [Agrobacterium sp. rho-13.3]MDX8310167.1 hypothetical protein [Agrobacterium sp. rho-13.3]